MTALIPITKKVTLTPFAFKISNSLGVRVPTQEKADASFTGKADRENNIP
jgi:hypothetical protein